MEAGEFEGHCFEGLGFGGELGGEFGGGGLGGLGGGEGGGGAVAAGELGLEEGVLAGEGGEFVFLWEVLLGVEGWMGVGRWFDGGRTSLATSPPSSPAVFSASRRSANSPSAFCHLLSASAASLASVLFSLSSSSIRSTCFR